MIKITPNNIYKTAVFENWLNEQARNGNIIKNINCFFCTFTSGEKDNSFYKMIPTGKKDNEKMSDEQIDKLKENEIEYVCTYKNHFHIVKTKNLESFNEIILSKAPEIQKNYKNLISNSYFYMILFFILCIAIFGFTLFDIFKHGAILYNIIRHEKWAFDILGIILTFDFGFKCLTNIQNLKSASKNILNDNEITKKDKSLLKYSKKSIITFLLALVITSGLTVHSMANSWNKNMEDIPKTMPILLLNMVEQDLGYHRYNPVAVGDGIIRKTNSAKFSYSILAPKQYEIVQVGIIEGETFENSNELYTPSSNVDFFRAANSSLAKTLYHDLIKKYSNIYELDILPSVEKIEIKDSDFEEAVIYKIGNQEHFFGYYDNNAIYVSYHGNHDILPFVNDIYGSIEYLEY